MPRLERIRFVSSDAPEAQKALEELVQRYGQSDPSHTDVVVALGGDGFMLQSIHQNFGTNIPIYGMNKGTVGFLMNSYDKEDLHERLAGAISTRISPLKMTATDIDGRTHTSLAIHVPQRSMAAVH